MSIDDARNWLHAQLLEKPVDDLTEPEWRRLARAQEAAEAKAREREAMELAASETPEAEEARWANRFRQSAREREVVHYARD